MDIPASLQPRTLIKLSFPALAAHFQGLIRHSPSVEQVNDTNSRLAYLVHTEAIPPAIYSVWLHIAVRHSPKLLRPALLDPESCAVRHAAIEVLSRIFHSRKWKQEGWDALGGAPGILEVFHQLSLSEVHSALAAIRRCGHKPGRQEVASRIEELVTLLTDDDNMSRPLAASSNLVLPLCSPQFVLRALNKKSEQQHSAHLLDGILQLHINLLRQIVIGSAKVPQLTRINIISKFATKLLISTEPYTPIHYEATAVDLKVPALALCKDLVYTVQRDRDLSIHIMRYIPEWIEGTMTILLRRNISFDDILQFLEIAFPTYLENVLSSALSYRLVPLLIQCWSVAGFGSAIGHPKNLVRRFGDSTPQCRPKKEHKHALESIMIAVLRDHPDRRLSPGNQLVDEVQGLLKKIAPKGRLAFLKILCKHIKYLDYDLDAFPPSERERRILPGWDPKILWILPGEDAKTLFARSLAIHECDEFVPEPGATSGGSYYLDWIVQCQMKVRWESLEAPAKDGLALTRQVIREAQLRAERDRTPEGRLKWAKAALSIATESGSREPFHETLRWSKRFVRDPFVFSPFIQHVLSFGEFLSCAPMPESRWPGSMAELEAIVHQSHDVLRTLLELSWLIQKEPGHLLSVLRPVERLFQSLVYQRAHSYRKYLKAGLGSAVDLDRVLFESLIPVIIEYEKEGASWTDDTNSTSNTWYKGNGLLRYGLPFHKDLPDALLQFLDRLAQERDSLWKKKRISNNPDVLDLGKGWPLGLSIQSLLPNPEWARLALLHPDLAPFTSARINQVLFSPYDVLSRVSPEDDSLIGCPDCLEYAIAAHISTGDSREERVLRAQQVASHYAEALKDDPRRDYFLHRLAGLGLDIIPEPKALPVIMTATYVDDSVSPDKVVEWSPQVTKAISLPSFPDVNPAHGRVTLLDLRINQDHGALRNEFSLPRQQQKSPQTFSELWPLPRDWKNSSLESRDAIALSAILLLDTLTQQRILQKPFPNVKTVRYPSIYLADEFLTLARPDPPMYYVLDILKEFLPSAPPTLLRNLANSLLEKPSGTEPTDKADRPHFAFVIELVKLITRSDKPGFAVDLFCKIILEYPEESSYHRHLNMNTLGSRLCPEESIALVRHFAARVCDGLRQQAQRTGATKETDNKAKAPYIKVTTAKMVAQMAIELEFLPPKISLEILQDLFMASPHIDIRVAVTSCILRLLKRGVASADIYQVLVSLAPFVIGPSERKQVTEEDWVTAENGGPLPHVDAGDDRPLLDIFITQMSAWLPAAYKVDYVEQVLIPLLDESTRQHERWIRAFLMQIGFPATVDIRGFPFGPFAPWMVKKILDYFRGYLSPSFLRRHRELALAYLQHPLLNAITDCLASHNREFRRTNEGKHWLEYLKLYRNSSAFLDIYVKDVRLEPLVPNGLTLHDFLTENRTRASIMARHPFVYVDSRKCVTLSQTVVKAPLEELRKLRDTYSGRHGGGNKREVWKLVQATMENIAEDLEAMRGEKQLDSVAVFPSSLEIKSYLLPSPVANPTVENPLAQFVNELLELLRVHSEDPLLVTEFHIIKKLVDQVPKEDSRACALLLGDLDETENQPVYACLRVQLAQSLITKLKNVDLLLDDKLRGMIQGWKKSSSEFIRGVGWKIDGSL